MWIVNQVHEEPGVLLADLTLVSAWLFFILSFNHTAGTLCTVQALILMKAPETPQVTLEAPILYEWRNTYRIIMILLQKTRTLLFSDSRLSARRCQISLSLDCIASECLIFKRLLKLLILVSENRLHEFWLRIRTGCPTISQTAKIFYFAPCTHEKHHPLSWWL